MKTTKKLFGGLIIDLIFTAICTVLATAQTDATMEKTKAAMQEKLDEFGVLDEQLDNEITQTEQRLQILFREQELREQNYNWNEISTIIKEEFSLEDTMRLGFGMAFYHGFGPGPNDCGNPPELSAVEETQQ